MAPTEVRLRGEGWAASPAEVEPTTTGLQPSDGNKRKLVGVDGYWYDVTDFISHHPGGPIIEEFIGKEASQVFHAYGHEGVLKYRKPVGTYMLPKRHPADEEFEKLRASFRERGYYVTDFNFYVKKVAFFLSLFVSAFVCVIAFEQWYMHYLGAVILAFVFQQTGFVMHEFMHSQVFRNKFKDSIGGTCVGTVFFGMSAHWWQDEHIIHHAMTNTCDGDTKFADPQMWESVWAQNTKMFPFFSGLLHWCLIRIQHITFIPLVVLIGRLEILTDSYRVERRWHEWVAIVVHWTWMCTLLSFLPTWREVAIFYAIAATVEGIFHFQLILSHYCREFYTVSEFHKTSWYAMQVLSNMNIEVPWWQDWYYGGLNFHIEHHLFPKIARKYLRTIGPEVEAVCKKHGIDYQMFTFTEAMKRTLVHLKHTGKLFKLEFR